MSTRQTAHLSQPLIDRGLAPVLLRAGIKPHAIHGAPGWLYPTFTLDGEPTPVSRWKAADSEAKPKYLWVPAEAEGRPVYYAMPGLRDAVQLANGLLYFAAGEPDLWTYLAAGYDNVWSWFGEGNVPPTLVEDLVALGVTRAVYCPDLDLAGLRSASKVHSALEGSPIQLDLRVLPGSFGDKSDINDLWVSCQFNPHVFEDCLDHLAPYNLLAYIETYDPPKPQQADDRTGQATSHSKPEELAEVKRRALVAIELALTKRGGKPGYYNCPFDDHGPDGKDFLFDPESGMIGGCQGKHAGMLTKWAELAAHLGIDVTAIGREVWEERNQAPNRPNATVRAVPKRDRRPGVRIVSVRESIDEYEATLRGELVPDVRPIPAPYKPLHRLGGLAALWEPRKTIFIVSGSGMGKTAFIETTMDGLNLGGHDTFAWGPEWSPVEYLMRKVAGWGGPSYEDQQLNRLWLIEEKHNVKERHGRPLTPDQRHKIDELIMQFKRWPGQNHWLDFAGGPLAVMLKAAAKRITDLRASGRQVSAFYFDYAQKAQKRADNWAELELIVNDIWQFGVDMDLVTVVASQVRKEDADKLRDGGTLGATASQSISDQKANVVLTLNPIYTKAGERLEKAWIRCVKNSAAPYPAQILVRTALHRHRWDEVVLDDGQQAPPAVQKDEIPF